MMDKFILLIKYILGFPKSLYVNLRLFRLPVALKLPVIVSHRTRIKSLSGRVTMDRPAMACLKVGFGDTPTIDFRSSRSVLNIKGTLLLHGKCRIGAGSKLHVQGTLEIGDKFNLAGGSTIVCNKYIAFGNHVMVSWDVLIIDTDQHPITNFEGERLNPDADIVLGSDVWVGARATILKGVTIGNNVIVGANAVVVNNQLQSNTIIAGNPAKVIKENIKWV
jgi:acetyltransferase-like isoleucine patch superfamily enzyme